MPQKKNNYVFIDSQNLNLSIRNCGWKLDFKRFYIYLKDKYKINKAFLFIGYVAGNESLYTFLQEAGYIVIFKPTLEYYPFHAEETDNFLALCWVRHIYKGVK